MFSVILSKQILRKNPVGVLQSFRRNMLQKKPQKVTDPFARVVEPFANFERLKTNKLIPPGYEVIYFSPLYRHVVFAYLCLPFTWAILLLDLYNFCTNENYMDRMQLPGAGTVTVTEKILHVMMTFGLSLFFHYTMSCVIVNIFKKGNEFITMTFGFFGPLRMRFIHHGPQALVPTKNKIVYKFQGKRFFLVSTGFQKYQDYMSVVRV